MSEAFGGEPWQIALAIIEGLVIGNWLFVWPRLWRRLNELKRPEIGPEFYDSLNAYRARGRAEFVAQLRMKEAQPPK